MHILITISKIFAVVDHLLYIDWLAELFSPENRIHIKIKILEIWLSKSISYVQTNRRPVINRLIYSNVKKFYACYLILQNMKISESVFVNNYKWISLWIFIWQRWTFVNVLVNTFYLDPSSESFFYSISFSLSMWFGFTKKVSNSWFSLRCHIILLLFLIHFFPITFPSSFIYIFLW